MGSLSKRAVVPLVCLAVPGLWAGMLWCVALLATPAPFAVLDKAMAGQVVGHIFVREAGFSLLAGGLLALLERALAAQRAEAGQGSGFSLNMGLALGAVFCTVVGYYALQPMLAAAKLGQATALSFGQLHAISFGLFGVKMLLVTTLALRAVWPRGAGAAP